MNGLIPTDYYKKDVISLTGKNTPVRKRAGSESRNRGKTEMGQLEFLFL